MSANTSFPESAPDLIAAECLLYLALKSSPSNPRIWSVPPQAHEHQRSPIQGSINFFQSPDNKPKFFNQNWLTAFMDATLKNISILSVLVVFAIIAAVIFGYGEYRHLLGRKADFLSLNTQNSRKGLELFNQINLLKRLADSDLKLIEHIARTELGLVREDELVFVYGPAEGSQISNSKTSEFTPAFRLLTEEEFDVLLKFDLKTFDFYEALAESEK